MDGQTVYVMCEYKDFDLIPVEAPVGYTYQAYFNCAVFSCKSFETSTAEDDARFFDTRGVDDGYL